MTTETYSIAPLLNDIFNGKTLDRASARGVVGQLMDGKLSQIQAAALLAALRMRGETADEIIGFAEAMRERAVKVPLERDGALVDIVGTGGTGINTFNVSTACLFVAAAGGARIAKHGNRGVTRRSGSADVLEALGVDLDHTPLELARSMREVGIVFLYARTHHPAMRFVAPIRSDIQARTIFNSLGPLTNPADAERQLMGVFDPHLTRTLAEVLKGLGLERAMVVHGGGLDELTVTAENVVSELRDGEIRDYTFTPEQVGLDRYPLEDVLGGAPDENARTIRHLLAGEMRGAKHDIVVLNAGAALYLADLADSIEAGVRMAEELVASGAAARKLEAFIALNR